MKGKRPGQVSRRDAAVRILFMKHKRESVKRGLSSNLTFEDFTGLSFANCYICGAPPSNKFKAATGTAEDVVFYNGIDRVNNLIGYRRDNCESCCYMCNQAKFTRSLDDFMSWVLRVANRYKVGKLPHSRLDRPIDRDYGRVMAAHWEYRVVSHTDEDGPYVGMHEVFMSEDGRIESYTEEPIFTANTVEGLNDHIKMLIDALSKSILDEEDLDNEVLAGLDITEIDEP